MEQVTKKRKKKGRFEPTPEHQRITKIMCELMKIRQLSDR